MGQSMSQMNDDDWAVGDRVERGAKLLDNLFPDWSNKIDLARFDIADADRCVLGQLGHKTDLVETSANVFAGVLAKLGRMLRNNYQIDDAADLEEDSGAAFGFERYSTDDYEYDLLEGLWHNEITKRL